MSCRATGERVGSDQGPDRVLPADRTRLALVVLLVAALALPGCIDSGTNGEDGAEYRLRGTFTNNSTQEDRDELDRYVRDRGGRMVVLESFPPQFDASELEAAGCEEVRRFAVNRTYVADVGNCTR